MDGRFVPNITIGPLVVDALRPVTDKVLDCHLMIVEPELRVADFAKAGADIISVHAEGASTIHLHRTVNQIKDLGCKAGVVLNPGTPPECLEYVLDCVDLILVMSVNPGFGGQSFIESQVEKIAKIKAMCDAKGVNPWIEVDGGVYPRQRLQGHRRRRQRPRRRLRRLQLARLRRRHRGHQGLQGAQVNLFFAD